MSNEKNFIDGLQFKAPHERAPEYVKANGSIKVAELPKILRSRADTGAAHHGEAWVQGVRFAANQIEATLARQEADNASSPNVIYRWRALDYSGFCYGSNPPHDLPSEACLTAFYRDPEGLRSALHEISATGNMTATDKQFLRHLQQIARDALAGAAPPSAPVGQEWTDEQCIEFASCAFRNAPRNPPEGVELTDIRMAASRVMRSAPAAAGVPTMSNVGLRKLSELQAQGYVVNGVSIIDPESSKRGLIDSLGYVGWHTPEQQAAQAAAQAVDLDAIRALAREMRDFSEQEVEPSLDTIDGWIERLESIDQQAGKEVERG